MEIFFYREILKEYEKLSMLFRNNFFEDEQFYKILIYTKTLINKCRIIKIGKMFYLS